MARTGRKLLTFPFSTDFLDLLQKLKKRLTNVNVVLSVKSGRIEVDVRGTREAVAWAVRELTALARGIKEPKN